MASNNRMASIGPNTQVEMVIEFLARDRVAQTQSVVVEVNRLGVVEKMDGDI